jgi:hypothetical protein
VVNVAKHRDGGVEHVATNPRWLSLGSRSLSTRTSKELGGS